MFIFSKLFYFYSRKILPGFKIKKNALVVDIGSGDKPFWRADVYVDDLSLGDVQRASHTKTIHNIGKFMDADVTNLPFKNKFFDFSFCSHLLEHVENPALAIDEITRVSKSGYIEIPNGIIETIQPFISHLWFVYKVKNKLVFVRKSKKMHEILLNNGVKYIPLINNNSDPFIRIHWKNSIDYDIIDPFTKNEKYFAPVKMKLKTKQISINYHIFLVKILRLFFYINKDLSKLV